MAISVVMPALEMAQETGKLLAWRKKEGEAVKKGEPLLEIETDKAVVEIEAPGDGILAGISAHEGAEIPVGQTIAWIVAAGEAVPPAPVAATQSARASSAPARIAPAAPPTGGQTSADAPQISPKARRLAKELGVDIAILRGTGPGGTITAEDVQADADSPKSAADEPLSQIARLMAARTTQSWTSVPHFFLVKDADCTELLALHKQFNASQGQPKITVTDLLIAIVARVLALHPRMNANWTVDTVHLNPSVNISVAMAVKDGVVGAVIPLANTLKLEEISALRLELTERARANRLRPADISGGTFTISNLGMFQVDAFTAIITPPQAAVLAVGAIASRVVAVDGVAAVRPILTMTLSSDHRVVDGARAAEFLRDLASAILEPAKWLSK